MTMPPLPLKLERKLQQEAESSAVVERVGDLAKVIADEFGAGWRELRVIQKIERWDLP